MTKLNFIDLFSGCGGLSEGFLKSERYRGLAHVEWELPMVKTLRNRLSQKWSHSPEESLKRVVHFDLQETDKLLSGNWNQELKDRYKNSNYENLPCSGLDGVIGDEQVDVIIGGPPCQAYSIAGRAQDGKSMKDDYRNYLFESFVRVVDHYKPKVFVFENVPGMLSAAPGDLLVTERIFEAFDKIGYEISPPNDLSSRIMVATDFGVPQKRRRVIIIGSRKSDNQLFLDIYKAISRESIPTKDHKTVFDGIGHLTPIKPLLERDSRDRVSHLPVDLCSPKHHVPRYHNKRDVSIFREWIERGMNTKSTEEKIKYYQDNVGKTSNHAKYRNLEWDRPSPTIVAHLHKDGLMFIHPDSEQARTLTVKEAALLQSFPPDYEFLGGAGDCYRMIGNAVPPLMAEKISIGIADVIS